jgi:PAS domain S-box-containing protein
MQQAQAHNKRSTKQAGNVHHDSTGDKAPYMNEQHGNIAAGLEKHKELEIYRRIFYASPDYIAFSRLSDGTYIDVNPGFERLLGYKRADVIGRTSAEVGIWPNEDPKQRAVYVETLRRDGMVRNYPGRLRTAAGDIIDVEASANVVDIDGEQILVVIVRDVTERKRAEKISQDNAAALRELNDTLEQRVRERTAQLQASEARIRSIFETSYQFMGLLTPEGALLDANRTSLEIIHCPIEKLVGRPFWETPWFKTMPGMPEKVRDAVMAAAKGHTTRQEIAVDLPEGRRTFDFSMRPILDAAGRVTAIVPEAMEITERRLAEEALRQAQKMEAVGQLTGGLAHDFNNLLAGIVGNLQLLRVRLAQGSTESLGRYVDAAESVAERAATLTHRLLAFSRRQTLDPRVTNVNELVESMAELIRRTVEPSVQVDILPADDAWNTLCDPHQLESALLNLAINARDAMPTGGRLTIATSNEVLYRAHAVAHEGVPPGDYVTISVIDTGTGMSPEVAARAFDPFFTTKPIGQGTGLGLSMIFGFIKQSGGYVRLQSEPGAGTTIRLHLPRHSGPAQHVAPAVPMTAAVAAPQRGTVLVVDDEAPLLSILTEMLTDAGYTALEATDAPSALQILQSSQHIDLLVSDVGLPGNMNGFQMVDAARRFRPGLKALYITGYAEYAAAAESLGQPGTELLSKPFALATFGERVAAMLGAEGNMTSGAVHAASGAIGKKLERYPVGPVSYVPNRGDQL